MTVDVQEERGGESSGDWRVATNFLGIYNTWGFQKDHNYRV